jgi:predicted membrane-bound mannosyltransferase/DNA-binding beta-propeller fold protein YncE
MNWNPEVSDAPGNTPSTIERLFQHRLTLNWEVTIYLVILVLAIFTRFYNLGDRVMSHDESLHTRFSYNLYSEGEFRHTPLMHGPILFHMVAFSYTLFGDNDFSARIYPAILGILMVFSPLLFRFWLKRWGTLIATLLILVSPLLMYYHRYIREDTPAIMAVILMIWGMMMYLSGPPEQRRKAYWLYVIGFGLIWGLGTKETAFMYVAVFGLFLALYWFVRLAQYFANQRGKVFPGKSVFGMVILGILMGGVLALGMYCILDIIQFDLVGGGEVVLFSTLQPAQQTTYFLWTFSAIFVVLLVIIVTVLWAYRDRLSALPWSQIALMIGIMFASALVLVVAEELSHVAPSSSEPAPQPVPGQEGTTSVIASTIRYTPMLLVWGICIIACAFFIIFRRRQNDVPADTHNGVAGSGLWGILDLFPEFDVMVIIGTLILPWSAAIIPYVMKGTTADFDSVGKLLPEFLLNIVRTVPNVGTVDQAGQFLLGFFAWLPLMVTSLVIGLAWNWRRWAVTAGIFYAVFVFFFTTVFTNPAGLGTGMYYSLGYWLEQQGERRGSQPQYYYLLVILPMYEFLVIIGTVLAMNAGLIVFWRRYRAEKQLEQDLTWQLVQNDLAQDNIQPMDNDQTEILPSSAVLENATVLQDEEDDETKEKRKRGDELEATLILNNAVSLTELPFLLWWAWLSIFNLIFFTFAGEKMPWLGTHMALPMIFVTAWFLGNIVSKIDWQVFVKRGWVQLSVTAVFTLTALQVFGTLIAGDPIFAGLSSDQLRDTQSWLASLSVMIISMCGLIWLSRQTSWQHTRQLFAVAFFGLAGILTFRSAWMASFINYDYTTEFLVYAHGAPAVKTVLKQMEDISFQTTNGMDLEFSYDNENAWPGSWYYRHFTKTDSGAYIGSNPTVQNLKDSIVVVVGGANKGKVEPILEDRYIMFEYNRLWWPMQEYFYLNTDRVNNFMDLSPTNTQAAQLRKAVFDIWWDRDYTAYGAIIGKDFSEPNWPVTDKMYVYIRKDIAAQIWTYGVGNGTVENPLANSEQNQCTANAQNLQPMQVIESLNSQMIYPLGMSFDVAGNLYVAEENGHRISVFDSNGNYVKSIGQFGNGLDGLQFNRPNSVTFAPDGSLFVVDTWNYRINRIDLSNDTVTARWGQVGTFGFDATSQPTDAFWGPRDIKVDSLGRVLVMDTGNKRIRVYQVQDNTPVWLFDIGTGGSGAGQLDEPTSMAIHPIDGRIFVADSWNRRIAVFTREGIFLDNYPVRAWYEQSGKAPYVAVDAQRELLYVTDPDGGRILVLTTSGDCVGSFGRGVGESASDTALFRTANGVAVDALGNVYVSDAELNRILKFAPFPVAQPQPVSQDGANGVVLETTPEATPEATQP